METSKGISLHVINKEAIVKKMREVLKKYKNIVICGEEGVGKITSTLEAVQNEANVYYIGNPVDYIGKPRPKGYDKYINYIMSLKNDMRIVADENEILSLDFPFLSESEAILVIDEIYGRSDEQCRKISEILTIKGVKVFLIAGCLKNAGRVIHGIDTVLMLTKDGVLLFDKEFAVQICTILKAETQ
ncbi:MAG: hypothetical protein M1353_12930 [Nitrospirae bacterium]|nr:hypothetical protein [Nitrospirota bacterium]